MVMVMVIVGIIQLNRRLFSRHMFYVYKKLNDPNSSKSIIVILHVGLLEITLKFPSKNGLNKLDRAKSYSHVGLTVLSIFQKVSF